MDMHTALHSNTAREKFIRLSEEQVLDLWEFAKSNKRKTIPCLIALVVSAQVVQYVGYEQAHANQSFMDIVKKSGVDSLPLNESLPGPVVGMTVGTTALAGPTGPMGVVPYTHVMPPEGIGLIGPLPPSITAL
jgi:hypothetical protein